MTDAQAHARTDLSVRPDERILVPGRITRPTWFSVTLAAILAVHAVLLAILLWRDADGAPALAKVEEMPVEVVTQAPEPPAPHPSAPQPPEKPASSAPRAPNQETLDRDAKDSESRAPKAQPPAPSQQVAAAPEQTTPEQAKSEPVKTDSAAKPPEDVWPAEALDKAPPEPPRRPAKLAHPTLAHATPAKPAPGKAPRTALQQLAGASDLPDYTFAKPMRKRARITGGTEDDRYLAVVYAMVTQSHQVVLLPDADWTVAVSFEVDGHGDLVGIGLTKSSGYPQVDAAAIDAVQRAAPFPPPPSGGVTGLVARLNSARARAAVAEDR